MIRDTNGVPVKAIKDRPGRWERFIGVKSSRRVICCSLYIALRTIFLQIANKTENRNSRRK